MFFEIPRGLRLNIASLSSANSATAYDFGSVGLTNGSLSYLYSSIPLPGPSKGNELNLRSYFPGYRHVRELRRSQEDWIREIWQNGLRIDRKDTLLYGRLFLPRSSLEALYLRRLTPIRQLRISCVSDGALNNGGTILALLQQNYGRYSTEYLYSTDSALLGARGLYNFGLAPSKGDEGEDEATRSSHTLTQDNLIGLLSAGAELYYGILNKSGGMSAGLRFTTLPPHTGFPYTMTLTVNPLMGNLSSTYAVKAGRDVSLCSQFDFNFYSYESDFRLGCELWKVQSNVDHMGKTSEWARRLLREDWYPPGRRPHVSDHENVSGVLKARWDQNWRIGLLWEGRIKEVLFSLGVIVDMRKREQIFRSVGAELQFSS